MQHGSPTEPPRLTAAVFDLDGVVTRTARLHVAAWGALLDDFLRERAARLGEAFRPFDREAEYRAYVDGRPREEGLRTFLSSRGISLPEGSPADPAGAPTLAGLARRKNLLFAQLLEREGAEVYAPAVSLVRTLRAQGVRVGVATSSRNADAVLKRAGLRELFDAVVDGVVSERLGLRGKPAPDIFLECVAALGGTPGRAAVFEDAAAGIEAARAGGFAVVIGVDHGGNRARLGEAGADWVVDDLGQVTPEALARLRDG